MKKARIASIDILRASTMFMMIWVNDFFTLTEVPKWLKHGPKGEEYIGFSDIIFPLFLFIMGASIPFAIQYRKRSGASTFSIAKHITLRSISLLIIGVYIVNYENAHHESIIIGTYFWCFLMALAVVLIWMNWRKSPMPKKWHVVIQLTGVLILVFLAVVYKGGPNGDLWLTTQWWGILGLIGWAYVSNTFGYLFAKGNVFAMIALFILFNVLAVLTYAGITDKMQGFISYFQTVYGGFIPAFTSAGVLAGLVLKEYTTLQSNKTILTLVGLGIANIVYGITMEPYFWMIYKLGVSIGISFLVLAVFYYMADVKKQTNWAKIIAPAGTATLTCYMVPYFVYPIRMITGFRFPDFMNTGVIGLLVSFGFALLVVVFIGWLEKKGFKLKI